MSTPFSVQRRSFLQTMGLSLGMTQMLHPLSMLSSSAYAQGGGVPHKALVCINLGGGNDSNNMIVPGPDHLQREDYVRYRQLPGEQAGDPTFVVSPNADTEILGPGLFFNPDCGKFQGLYNDGNLACLLNVGNIFGRVATRADLYDDFNQRRFPQFYGSHSNATIFWNAGLCQDDSTQSGWGGRLAEWMKDQEVYNLQSQVSPSFSVNSISALLAGEQGTVLPYTVRSPGAAPSLNTTNYFHDDRLADFGAIMSRSAQAAVAQHAPLHADMGRKFLSSQEQAELVGPAFDDVALNQGIDEAFTTEGASGGLADQLKAVAKLIIKHNTLSQDRQFFVVGQGGYDTHTLQLENHPELLADLANAMTAFRNVLRTAGKLGDTITFTVSDFGRTLVPSNDGTNHAWGGHALIMGESPTVAMPGQMEYRPGFYGNYPLLNLDNGQNSMSINQEGRFIPQVATSEYAARFAQWFGIDQNQSELFGLFPELENFYTPDAAGLEAFEDNVDLDFLLRVPS